MSVFFTHLLLRSICGTRNSSQQTSLQCLSTINVVFSDEDKILIKKNLYLKRYTPKRLTDEFPKKSWTQHGVNDLLEKLQELKSVYRKCTLFAFFSTSVEYQKLTFSFPKVV